MKSKAYHTYILTNKNNTVIYTGVTSRIEQRVWEHKESHDRDSFTARYRISKLVYIEEYQNAIDAINREKQIKNFSRKKKVELVNRSNPKWKDLLLDT